MTWDEDEDDSDLEGFIVLPCPACPVCGEDRQGFLVWMDIDDDVVECGSCRTKFLPGKGPLERN